MKRSQEIASILPERIQFYRQKKKLTQGQLAELVNVTEHYMMEIENAIKFPSMELIKNISLALNVPIYCLMQTQTDVDSTNYTELQNILSLKDEAELSTLLDVLLTVNKLETIDI
ncbi:hypothetical protein IMSAG013_00827 [Clostridiales bacterium]|nr:hypothetical protein IMSAG013_00827 [Clostridiales bacterium]